MNEAAKEYLIDFFTKRLRHFGDTPAAVGWSEKGQILRYQTITELLSLDNASVLDFGCGKGDFYGFLRAKGLNLKYTGMDINPELIRVAREKYIDASFRTIDIDKEDLGENFDFIIICGVFNLRIEGVKDAALKCIEKLFNHTERTLLFNCPSIYAKNKDRELIYYDPRELLDLALNMTKNVNLYHNLIEGEIFLELSREEQIYG
ncbi:MAG: class I SAM-dependent methyltransferase [Thermodesulfovibrionales bacterium]|nr:class I SAM-dependent methyltransferase [Thermodesulfovibrionales bacterium]